MARESFQDTENVFNNIVVNKLKTADPIYLSKLFYLLNLGVYLYHKKKKNSHTLNLKLIIKNKIKYMMSSIRLSLSTHKKKE